MSPNGHRRASKSVRRRRLYALLVVVFVAVGVGLFLSVGSGAETGGAGDGTAGTTIQAMHASQGAATSQGKAVASKSPSTAATVSETRAASASETTTTTLLLESASLPGRLPADAAKVHAPILMYHYVDETPPPAGPYADGLTVRTNDFRAEMQYLVDNRYQTVTFADVYRAMAGLQCRTPRNSPPLAPTNSPPAIVCQF